MNIYNVIKRPLVTEKSTLLRESSQTYVFETDLAADKLSIRSAVEKLFNVKVARVRTCVMPRSYKRVGRFLAETKKWKKAMVTLKEGKIELFEGV